MIHTLFPSEVVTITATPDMWSGSLFPEEEACILRAVAKRRGEFTAGRLCARKALSLLGIEGFPLLMGADRLPVWPAGVVGSISHCPGHCGVAVARAGPIVSLGLDVEEANALGGDLVPMVCSDRELEQAALFPHLAREQVAKILFSAKECAFKCWYPLGRAYLDFHDVEVTLVPDGAAFKARFLEGAAVLPGGAALEGRFAVDETHVFCGVTLRAT